MFKKIEDFLLNKFAGKLIARGIASLAGTVVGLAASNGLTLDPVQTIGLLNLAAQWLFEWFKKRRMANPESPAVQTDKALLPPAVG